MIGAAKRSYQTSHGTITFRMFAEGVRSLTLNGWCRLTCHVPSSRGLEWSNRFETNSAVALLRTGTLNTNNVVLAGLKASGRDNETIPSTSAKEPW